MNQNQAIETIQASIVSGAQPRSMLLYGTWGIGKTHVLHCAFANRAKDTIWVSLYGKQTIGEVYNEILFKILRISGKDVLNGLQTSLDFLSKVKPEITTRYQRIIGEAQRFFILETLSNSIVLILDDLERMSSSISIEEIGGLIEQLKTRCWVISVANIVEIRSKKRFSQFRERFFEKEIHLDQVSEALIAKLIDSFAETHLSDRTKKIAVDIVLELRTKNLRIVAKFVNILVDFSQLCEDRKNEILEQDLFLKIVFGLTVYIYQDEGKISELRRDLHSSDEDSALTKFCRTYRIRRTIELSFDPFLQFFESRAVFVKGFLHSLNIQDDDRRAVAYNRITNWFCYVHGTVREDINTLVEVFKTEEKFNFSLFEVVYVATSVFSLVQETRIPLNYEKFRGLILSTLEAIASQYSDQTIEEEVRHISVAIRAPSLADEVKTYSRHIESFHARQREKSYFSEYEAHYKSKRYYPAIAVCSRDGFPLTRLEGLVRDLLLPAVPIDLLFAVKNEIEREAGAFTAYIRAAMQKYYVVEKDLVRRRRISMLMKDVAV